MFEIGRNYEIKERFDGSTRRYKVTVLMHEGHLLRVTRMGEAEEFIFNTASGTFHSARLLEEAPEKTVLDDQLKPASRDNKWKRRKVGPLAI